MPGNIAYIAALLAAGALTGFLALYSWRKRRGSVAPSFALLMAATTVYTLGYAMELACATLEGILFWLKIEYLGISPLPALWLVMAIQYSGKSRWLTRTVLLSLFIIPLVTLVMNFTNEFHYLFYRDPRVSLEGPFPLFSFIKGPWYWVHVAYINFSVLFGNILFFRIWRRSAPSYRRQAALMLAGSMAPWAAFLIYLSGKSPWGLDLTPFGFAISGPICAWGLFSHYLLDLVPIARDAVFEGMRDGVIVVDASNRIVDFNPAARAILSMLLPEDIGRSATEVLKTHPTLADQISMDACEQEELQVISGGGTRHYHIQASPIVGRKGSHLGKTVVLSDITQQVLLLEKLKSLATVDDLTGLFNRRHFLDLGRKEIDRVKRYGSLVSVIIIDLDNFKSVNDKYGHHAGDVTLRTVAGRFRDALRVTDLIGRYGGEEFAVILPETPTDRAYLAAELLRKCIADTPVTVDGEEVKVTASFGVAGLNITENADLDLLLRAADRALYKAKENGRNRVELAVE